MNPGKKNSNLLKNTGIHFLEFALGFLSLAKCHYQPSHDMKVNSLPFFALIALDSWADQDYTMSELADKLSITKQQLSHMIKVLEERGLVERIHDTANRRRVYIRICDSGREMMNQMKQEMLSSTLFGLRAYTPEELASMDECLCRLMELMKKFNCETDEPETLRAYTYAVRQYFTYYRDITYPNLKLYKIFLLEHYKPQTINQRI